MADVNISPRNIRRGLGLNQTDFWSTIGVAQSTGSRYESGRTMPKPVRTLLLLVHGNAMAPLHGQEEDLGEQSIDAPLDPREIRSKLGASQREFWSSIGMTQSAGSRYESGRAMPRTVQTLLRLVQAERIASAGELRNRLHAS